MGSKNLNISLLAAALTSLTICDLAGCASTPAPTPDLAAAKALISQAEGASAQQYAAADLETARSEYREADQLQRDKPERASELARQSAVDAQVAMARAQSAKAQQALRQVNAGTDALRSESARDAEKSGADADNMMAPPTSPALLPPPVQP